MSQKSSHHENTLLSPKKTIVVDIIPPDKTTSQARQEVDELCRLVETYGGIVILEVLQKRGRPSSKTFLGEGKAEEAAEKAKEHKVDMVIINGFLKPAQSTHLRKLFSYDPKDLTGQKDIPIWDRTDIILKIFEKHAKSQKALLQIKLAQLKHQIPKIYQYQTKLFDKERGGISGNRGAGEKGIEQEKRHIRNQIKEVEKKLELVKNTHTNQRERRKKNGLKTVALVGYTNAGKSTLLKALTKKDTYIADELFATLDTKLGSIWLPDANNPWKGEKVLIADTIGFIQNLPPHLIESFKATLDEVQEADLILHVIDSSDPEQAMKIKVVDDILQDLVDEQTSIVRVFNKSDQQTYCLREQKGQLCVSAGKKTGLDDLKEGVQKLIKA
ncbi:MAG: GTPase HflX [Candidatus Altimarinota bacterium]